jgi:hypothetical protein
MFAEGCAVARTGVTCLPAPSWGQLCVLLAERDPPRFERAALRWLERFIAERLPPIAEAALATSALAELRRSLRAR